MGNLIETLLKVDSHTYSSTREKFARMCVELDLTKPLEAYVQIDNTWYFIQYEGLPEICYKCGKFGHKKEQCPLMDLELDSEMFQNENMGLKDKVQKEETINGMVLEILLLSVTMGPSMAHGIKYLLGETTERKSKGQVRALK